MCIFLSFRIFQRKEFIHSDLITKIEFYSSETLINTVSVSIKQITKISLNLKNVAKLKF